MEKKKFSGLNGEWYEIEMQGNDQQYRTFYIL